MSARAAFATAIRWAADPARFAREALGFDPDPWQATVLQSAGRRLLLNCSRQSGKALHIDTPIPTPAGWTTMGALAPGDMVFDEQGAPCRVESCSDITNREVFRVRFSDGSEIVADGEHLWTTLDAAARSALSRTIGDVPVEWARWEAKGRPVARSRQPGEQPCGFPSCDKPLLANGLCAGHNAQRAKGRTLAALGHPHPAAATRTTLELIGTLTCGGRGDTNHAIPTARALQMPAADLPIDPYVLGAWLGDGTSANASITCAPEGEEIIEEIRRSGYTVDANGTPGRFTIRGLFRQLRLRGLLRNKHIPPEYLRAGVDQRIALLQGLMDTDGYAGKNRCEFTTTSPALAGGVYELAVSLGLLPTLKESRATLNGRDIGPKWRIFFMPTFVPFRLRYKAERLRFDGPRKTLRKLRYIVEIEPAGVAPVKCIAVSSGSRLYLAGPAMIPTHNSTTAAALALHQAIYHPGSLVLLVSPSLRQSGELFKKVIAHLKALEMAPPIIEENKQTLTLRGGSRIVSLPGTEGTIRGFSGASLIIEDEAARVEDDLHLAIRPMLAVSGGRLILASTPFGPRGHFFEAWENGGPGWERIEIPATKCPRISPEFLAEERAAMGDWWFRQEYGCEFVASDDQIFTHELIEGALCDDIPLCIY